MELELLKIIAKSGLSQVKFANMIGYSRVNLNHIINSNQGRVITLCLAKKLCYNGYGSVDYWMNIKKK
jgi:plasmid maintenance system antidote protein VapI